MWFDPRSGVAAPDGRPGGLGRCFRANTHPASLAAARPAGRPSLQPCGRAASQPGGGLVRIRGAPGDGCTDPAGPIWVRLASYQDTRLRGSEAAR